MVGCVRKSDGWATPNVTSRPPGTASLDSRNPGCRAGKSLHRTNLEGARVRISCVFDKVRKIGVVVVSFAS
jgi:hypothetical protein